MKLVPRAVTLNMGRGMLTLKKDSPHIFFVAGIVGVVVSTVLACRATLKLEETLDNIQGDLKNVNDVEVTEIETEQEHKKDVGYVYVKSGLQIAKLYAPAVIIGAASITALTGSHVQLSRRNASLMAAYAIVQKAYEDYRERVQEELGKQRELELFRGEKTEAVEGSKELVKLHDPNKLSPYSKIFDEYSREWEKDPELNRLFVQCQQNYANNLLHARGHVFLNEVYDMLGIDRTKAGAVVGWVISKDGGDNYIDFGIFNPGTTNFVNGWERSIVLDFNVDGVIYDKI